LLELQQLTHEVEVGGDDAPSVLDKLVRVDKTHGVMFDEVGHGDGGAPAHPSLAVDQYCAPPVSSQVDEVEGLFEILLEVLITIVGCVQLFVGDRLGHVVDWIYGGDVEDMVYAQSGHGLRVAGVLHVAEVEEGCNLTGGVVLDVLGDTEV